MWCMHFYKVYKVVNLRDLVIVLMGDRMFLVRSSISYVTSLHLAQGKRALITLLQLYVAVVVLRLSGSFFVSGRRKIESINKSSTSISERSFYTKVGRRKTCPSVPRLPSTLPRMEVSRLWAGLYEKTSRTFTRFSFCAKASTLPADTFERERSLCEQREFCFYL